MALKYRGSIIGSILCSIFVALFWGANLGAVYPFIEVVLNNKSLHDWTDENIAEINVEIQSREQAKAELLAGESSGSAANRELALINSELGMYKRKLGWAQYWQV